MRKLKAYKLIKYINKTSLLALAFTSSLALASDLYVPNLGTAGSLGLSVQKEQAIGDFFLRTARAHMPVIDDPVMTEYINTLGNRLLAHADNVNFPFDFLLINDTNLNASAFLGGKVAINTGLFNYAATEDQFASVIAHEISHVTQRHIARFLEGLSYANQLSTAGIIGAVALSILNPALGAAAVSTSVGISAQTRINFTRDNEYEADRVGINLLYRAGLNPQGTVDMFKTLSDMQGNVNPAFTLLIDHPLSQVRMAEAQNRVAQYQKRKNSTNPDYDFARARVAVRYSRLDAKGLESLKNRLLNSQSNRDFSHNFIHYALALIYLEQNNLNLAKSELNKLNKNNNLFVIDALSDIDLKAKNYEASIERLKKHYKRLPNNQVIVINLLNSLNEAQKYSEAQSIAERYLKYKPQDLLALSMLEIAQNRQHKKCDALQTRGEIFALSAAYTQAISMYNQALQHCTNHLTRERIKARVSQIVTQRAFDEELTKK